LRQDKNKILPFFSKPMNPVGFYGLDVLPAPGGVSLAAYDG
jgi:hypothetical protein